MPRRRGQGASGANQKLSTPTLAGSQGGTTLRTGTKGNDMILSNTENVPGKTIHEFYGVATGSTVRAKHVGKDILASLRNIVGGELKGYG